MAFSGQEYWSGLSLSSPGDLLDSGIEPGSPALYRQILHCLRDQGSGLNVSELVTKEMHYKLPTTIIITCYYYYYFGYQIITVLLIAISITGELERHENEPFNISTGGPNW